MANFPGTTRRFYPGLYAGGEASNPIVSGATFQSQWNTHFAPYYSSWVAEGVYFGFNVQVEWGDLYVDGSVRPGNPEDPDDPGYNWSSLDDILTAPVLNDGSTQAKANILLRDRSGPNPQPTFVTQAPYNGTFIIAAKFGDKSVVAFHRQTAVDELSKFYKAFALRYGQDSRIASVTLEEEVLMGNEPSDKNSPIGGATRGLPWIDCYHQGVIDTRAALAENAPNMVVLHKNMIPVYTTGVAGNPGMIDKGIGAGYPDPRILFETCGTGSWPAADCPTSGAYWVLQNYRDSMPVSMSSEPNGWFVRAWEGDLAWDRANPFGYTGNQSVACNPKIFLWYCGGAAKNDPPYPDLGSGDTATYPAGVLGVHYITCIEKNDGTNREWVADWVPAITDLGPQNIFAVPYFPPGYPGEGGGTPAPLAAVRINCGDNSYVDSVGNQWDSDATYTAETGSSTLSDPITNNTGYDNALFTKSRLDKDHDNSLFTISNLENGSCTVNLGFIETYALAGVGTRLFHIDINGVRKKTNYDIYSNAGAQIATAVVETFTGIEVTGGQITILLTDTAADRGHISFIEIIQTVSTQQFTVLEGATDRELSREIDGMGDLRITINKAAVVSWSDIDLKVVSQEPNEQLRGVKLKTDVP